MTRCKLHCKPETQERLDREHRERRARELPARKARWRARIATYAARGWTELVDTERALFAGHYGEEA